MNACVSGLIGNRLDSGVASAATHCVRLITTRGVPENHDVLRAMHDAFVESIATMVRACDPAGASPADEFSRKALADFARSGALLDFRPDGENLPSELLEERVRAIYGHADRSAGEAATELVIEFIEAGMDDHLTQALREVFRKGFGRYRGWAETFEMFLADKVKKRTEVFRILQFDRTN